MSSGKFFCIYSGKEYDDCERSEEHIVPISIGGSNEFVTKDVQRKANNDAGSMIDAPLIDSWPITNERWRLNLKSQSGSVPPVVLDGTIDVNGRTVKASYHIKPNRSVELISVPEVNCDWASGTIKIGCDVKDLEKIAANIERKAERRGIKLDRSKLTDKAGQSILLENPFINAQLTFDVNALTPCILKMALATGHLVLGERWSRGDDAELIRKAMWEPDRSNLKTHKIPGSVWPNCAATLKPVTDIGPDRHLLMVLNTGPLSFYCILFGQFEGMIQLQKDVWVGPELSIGDGRVFIIECKSRHLESLSFGQFVSKRGSGKYG